LVSEIRRTITEEVIQVGGMKVAVHDQPTLVTKQPDVELLPLFVGYVKEGGLVISQPFLLGGRALM
jgi:hypothetical protein